MRNISKRKTSLFKGVCQRRGKWYAQYQAALFYQEFDSEMEAVAHYMAVFGQFNKDSPEVVREMWNRNSPDLGRPDLSVVSHYAPDGGRQFPIDKDPDHIVLISGQDYDLRSFWWFVDHSQPMPRVATVKLSAVAKRGRGLGFTFDKIYMDNVVLAAKQGRSFDFSSPDLRPIYKDGNWRNLRRSNLEPSQVGDLPDPGGSIQ